MRLQAQRHAVGGIPLQLGAQRNLILVTQPSTGVPVGLPGTALFGRDGQTTEPAIRQAAGNETLALDLVVRTIGDREARMGIRRRPIGDEIDFAARGVAAVQSTLRSAQHLDAIDVEQLPGGLDRQG